MPLNQKYTGTNLGSLKTVKRISVSSIICIGYPFQGILYLSDIVLAVGASWEEIVHIDETAYLDQNEKERDGNPYFEIECGLQIAKIQAAVSSALEKIKYDDHILLVTDHNGQSFLVGSIDSPLQMKITNITTGKKATGRPGYMVKFLGTALEPCPVVDLSA